MNSGFNRLFRRNNRSRRGQGRPNQTPQTERDWWLILVLFIFNAYSFYTSYKGAEQIFPDIALPMALFIQSVLFLTLAGLAVKFSVFFRKWFAIAIFAGLSIYTSFFFLYDSLTKETVANRNIGKATAAHSRLVSKVYAPLKARYNKLREDADYLRRKAKDEARIGLTTGIVGCGPKCQQYEIEALQKEAERDSLEFQVQELDQLYNYTLVNLSPSEIFEQDKLALSQTPSEFLPDEYRNLELPRKEYIDEESEVRILAPFYKLRAKDERVREFARSSLGAALLVDGMAIVLGTAVTRRRRQKSTIREIMEKWAVLIYDSWRGSQELVQTIRQIRTPSLKKNVDTDNNPDVEVVDRELARLGMTARKMSPASSDYFSILYNSIDSFPPFRINYTALQNSGLEYRPLLEALLYHGIIEIVNNGNNNGNQEWRVKPDYYYQLTRWLVNERAQNQNRQRRARNRYSTFGFQEQNQNQRSNR